MSDKPALRPGERMAGSTVMSPSGPLSLSYSQISTYGMCPERYRLRYREQVPEEASGAAFGGIAIHDAIEEAENHEWWRDPNLPAMQQAFAIRFGTLIAEAGGEDRVRWTGRKTKQFPVGEGLLWWCFYSKKMLLKYAAIRRRDEEKGWWVQPGGVERWVSTNLETGCMVCRGDGVLGGQECSTCQGSGKAQTRLTGKVDIMLVFSDAGPIIRDWKSGASPGDPSQLAVYAWLLQESGLPPITRGQVGYLRGSFERGTLLREHDLTPWIPLVPRMFRDLATGIQRQVFPMVPSSFCGSCGVRAHCDWGRTLEEAPLRDE